MIHPLHHRRATTALSPLLILHCFLCLKGTLAIVFFPLNDTTIQQAVNAWISNATNATAVYGPIQTWNTSLVTNMDSLFNFKPYFNEDLSGWDTSRVTDMSAVFKGATTFNGNISTWDTSSLIRMAGMFHSAYKFNGDLSKWNIGKVTNLSWMFYYAYLFNGDVSTWNTSKVVDMSGLFNSAKAFNQSVAKWDTLRVTNMAWIFSEAYSYRADSKLAWDTARVTNMFSAFFRAYSFNADISSWDTNKVTNMGYTFLRASSFNGKLAAWNTTKVTDMNLMFANAASFNSNLALWDTSRVTDVSFMFAHASSFNGDLSSWDTSKVKNSTRMFYNATSFNGNIRSWDTSRVLDMSQMFVGAKAFNQTLCWNTTSVALKVNVFEQSRGAFSSSTFPSCRTLTPTAKPSARPTFRSTLKPTIWPKPWLSDTSIMYGSTTSYPTFNHSACPEGSKVVRMTVRAESWIIQLSATCDDKGNTVLGPWGQPQGTLAVVPPCAEGYIGWNITYGSYIGQMSFACASSSYSFCPPMGYALALGSGSTNQTLLSWNQSIVGFQVHHDSLGIRAMKFEYAELPSKDRCDPTVHCPSKKDWLVLSSFYFVVSVVLGICVFLFGDEIYFMLIS